MNMTTGGYKATFIPSNKTPLSEYLVAYILDGASYEQVQNLLQGLSKSTVYET